MPGAYVVKISRMNVNRDTKLEREYNRCDALFFCWKDDDPNGPVSASYWAEMGRAFVALQHPESRSL